MRSSPPQEESCEEVEELNTLEKMEEFFSAVPRRGVLTLNCEKSDKGSGSPAAGGSGVPNLRVLPSYSLGFLNMTRVSGKPCRLHYLVIFSHYLAIFKVHF